MKTINKWYRKRWAGLRANKTSFTKVSVDRIWPVHCFRGLVITTILILCSGNTNLVTKPEKHKEKHDLSILCFDQILKKTERDVFILKPVNLLRWLPPPATSDHPPRCTHRETTHPGHSPVAANQDEWADSTTSLSQAGNVTDVYSLNICLFAYLGRGKKPLSVVFLVHLLPT